MNSDDPGADLDAALDRLTTAELRDVMLVGKILAGRPLRIDTDNPKTVARARALAAVSARSRLGTAAPLSSSIRQRRNDCFRTCDKLRQAARILNRINGNDKMPCPTCG
jgi:hypothetical protein